MYNWCTIFLFSYLLSPFMLPSIDGDFCTPLIKKCYLLRFHPFSLSYTLPYSTDRRPRELRENSDSTPHLPKVLFLKIENLKKLSPILKKLTHFLKPLTYIPRLYTLHFTPYTRKIALKCDFSCTSANFIVPLHREPALGMSAHQQRRVADIIKRRLLALVLASWNPENFVTQSKRAVNAPWCV